MNNVKKISVILPTYNRAWCVKRAINSILNQTYQNWELIIIDDGSRDGTGGVISKYLTDRRIYFIKFSENKGLNVARNKGLDLASGGYITFLDSDDEFLPNGLQIIADEFEKVDNKKIAVLLFDCINEKGDIIGTKNKNNEIINLRDWIETKKFSGEKLPVIAQFIKDENFRFIDSRGQLEGYFWYMIARKYCTKLVDKTVRIYHKNHSDRLTGIGQMVEKAKYQGKAYDIFLTEFKKDIAEVSPKKLSYFYLEKGLNEIINNKKQKGRKSILASVKYNKNKIALVIAILTLSFLPNKIFIKLAKIAHKFKAILK